MQSYCEPSTHRYWYSVSQLMPKSRATCVFGSPAATLFFRSATCSLFSAFFRPRYAPRFHSLSKARSNSAKDPMTESIRLAIGESSPVKVTPFFTNSMRTPLFVRFCNQTVFIFSIHLASILILIMHFIAIKKFHPLIPALVFVNIGNLLRWTKFNETMQTKTLTCKFFPISLLGASLLFFASAHFFLSPPCSRQSHY